MKMKRIFCLILALVMLLSIAGCGNKPEDEQKDPNPGTEVTGDPSSMPAVTTIVLMFAVPFVMCDKPLRLIAMGGLTGAGICFAIALVYLILKLIFWDTFAVGMAFVVIGLFFLGFVQMFFTGILGEYIGSLVTRVKKRPKVVEKERINFENGFYTADQLKAEKETVEV